MIRVFLAWLKPGEKDQRTHLWPGLFYRKKQTHQNDPASEGISPSLQYFGAGAPAVSAPGAWGGGPSRSARGWGWGRRARVIPASVVGPTSGQQDFGLLAAVFSAQSFVVWGGGVSSFWERGWKQGLPALRKLAFPSEERRRVCESGLSVP